MTFEDDVKEGKITEDEYYKSTKLFSKNGLVIYNFHDVIWCWDIWLAIILTIVLCGILFLLNKIPLNALVEYSKPVYVALIIIFVTGITILFTFGKNDKYMEKIRKKRTYRNFIFIPYWGAAITLFGLLISIISSLFMGVISDYVWLEWICLFINLFLLLYVIFLIGNFVGTLVRHGIYKMRIMDEKEEMEK